MLGRTMAILAISVLAIATAGCASPGARNESTTITVASEKCGSGWSDPHAGHQEFVLANTDIVAGEVFLVNATTGAVFAYVDNLGPGASASLDVDLGSGRYEFRCAMGDEGVALGSDVVIPGKSAGGPAPVSVVTENDLIPLAKKYDAWVETQLPTLQLLVGTLGRDVAAGDLSAARIAWLPAHLAYEKLGAAYGAFGAADKAINGLPSGLVQGVADPAFTGFHRIEYGLWHGQTAAELAPIAGALTTNVDSLATTFDETLVDPLDLGLRCHEISENALQFDLTGQTDFGSGSTLASVSAELEGTNELLTLLAPILKSRYPELGEAERALERTTADVAAEHGSGRWTPLNALPQTTHERLDADLSGLATLLAPVASITEPRIDS